MIDFEDIVRATALKHYGDDSEEAMQAVKYRKDFLWKPYFAYFEALRKEGFAFLDDLPWVKQWYPTPRGSLIPPWKSKPYDVSVAEATSMYLDGLIDEKWFLYYLMCCVQLVDIEKCFAETDILAYEHPVKDLLKEACWKHCYMFPWRFDYAARLLSTTSVYSDEHKRLDIGLHNGSITQDDLKRNAKIPMHSLSAGARRNSDR